MISAAVSKANKKLQNKLKKALLSKLSDLGLPDDLNKLYQNYVEEFNVEPAGLIEGKNFEVNYDWVNIRNIASALIKLAAVQGDDWLTDQAYSADRSMFARVVLGKYDSYTIGWYRHEVTELTEIRRVTGWDGLSDRAYVDLQTAAHNFTLKIQGNDQWDLYHPSVVRAHDYSFGPIYPRE